jgi:hypothetical protein
MLTHMPNHLRHIAVYVDERRRGQFAWVLIEQEGDAWAELQRDTRSAPTYREALAGGLQALQDLAGDLDGGPRAIPEKAAPQVSAKKAFFGFGPVR